MDVKPTPKPRNSISTFPIPAPRSQIFHSTQPPCPQLPSPPSSLRYNIKQSSTEETSPQSSRTSGRHLKNEPTQLKTARRKVGIAVMRSQSVPLGNSAGKFSHSESNNRDTGMTKTEQEDDRCVSMPVCDDIFRSISFHSPMESNLKSLPNEEDLTEAISRSPPPAYPPPPLPDESIYDALQSNNFNDAKHNSADDSEVLPAVMRQNEEVENENQRVSEKLPTSTVSVIFRKPEINDRTIISVRNSLYENWMPRIEEELEIRSTSKSVLFEFDPLAKNEKENYEVQEDNDLMLLETLLATDESSNCGSSFYNEQEYEIEGHPSHPPAPPERFDSLSKNKYDEVTVENFPEELTRDPERHFESVDLNKKRQPTVHLTMSSSNDIPEDSASTSECGDKFEVQPNLPSNHMKTVIQKLKNFGDTRVKKPNVINFMRSSGLLRQDSTKKNGKSPISMVRPNFPTPVNPIRHKSIVYRAGVGIERAKELVQRAAVLADRKISFYSDKGMTSVRELLVLDSIQSVNLLQNVKVVDGETVHCIAVSCEGRPTVHVFYPKGLTERRIWAQRILEALTPAFPIKYTSEFTRAGWAYVKEGVTGVWYPAWVLLQGRTLVYTRSSEEDEPKQIDLRKARCILLREQDGPNPESKNVPVVVLNADGCGTLHLAAPESREVSAWRYALYQAATNCGPSLSEQQLTQDNLPVILDKCINFIYAHGIMSEGIYRKGGSSSAIARLLEDLRRDAWGTQITRVSYSEHDVATALRRFLRDLPEPLLPSSVNDRLLRIIDVPSDQERATAYRTILFPVLDCVSSTTLRRILAHLHFLCRQSSRNLMTVENISSVWGPTLMHAGSRSTEEWNRSNSKVVGDLINLYPKLYELTADDFTKEAKIFEVLERHHVLNNTLLGAPSGDLKVWICLLDKNGESVNVTIGPQKTALDVCRELSERIKIPSYALCLEETILRGSLYRPLHYTEKVLDVVARWGYWDAEDRKDNILVLKRDQLYKEIVPRIKPPMTTSGELKFADSKTKHFKNYLFEFSQAKLCCYKDKACCVKIHEWRIEDIVWYLGHEPKRAPRMGWCITFITKDRKQSRCKETPFFGNTLAGTLVIDQYKWLSAMLFGEHQLNLFPTVVDLMDP